MKCSLSILLIATTLPAAYAQSFATFTFDAPGATSTTATGMNNAGDIVGGFQDATGFHSYLRRANGPFVTIDAPGALPGMTYAAGINNLGQIAGIFADATGTHAFIRAADGSFTSFDIPDQTPPIGVRGINDHGDIAGTSRVAGGFQQGFLRHADGSIVTFKMPGSSQTWTGGINNNGDIVGTYITGGSYSVQHGFLRKADGSFTAINATGIEASHAGTALTGINNVGQITGYLTGYGISIVRDPSGAFTMLSVFSQTYPFAYAIPDAIDDNGRLAGYVYDSRAHGLLATPVAPVTQPVIRPVLGVASATAFGGFPTIAPGTWIEIYGSNLAKTTRSWQSSDFVAGVAPTSMDGVSVTVGGRPAFVSYVSPSQVNVQVPFGIAPGNVPVVVSSEGQRSLPVAVPVATLKPGLLALPPESTSSPQEAITLPASPVKAGDTITFFAIGCGPVTPDTPAGRIAEGLPVLQSTVEVNFGGTPGKVTWAGLSPGSVGLYQINVEVPADIVPSGLDLLSVPVTIRIDNEPAQQVLSRLRR
jgi:uncharacterized protein (TIGR03437 family)